MIVTSSVTLMAEENGIEFKCGVDNHSEDRVLSLEYPIVPNMATITEDGEEDYIAHPFATGFEVNNPMKVLKRTGSGFVLCRTRKASRGRRCSSLPITARAGAGCISRRWTAKGIRNG